MAQISEVKRFEGAFLISAEMLERIISIASDFMGEKPSIDVQYTTGRSITFDNIPELIDDDTTKGALIDSIRIHGWTSEKKIEIGFRKGYMEQVVIELKGERSIVTVSIEKITNEINSGRSHYSLLRKKIIGQDISLILLCLFSGAVFSFILSSAPDINNKRLLTLILYFIGFNVLFWLFEVLTPNIEFDFGRGHRSFEIKTTWRKILFGMVCLGIFVNVVSEFVKF